MVSETLLHYPKRILSSQVYADARLIIAVIIIRFYLENPVWNTAIIISTFAESPAGGIRTVSGLITNLLRPQQKGVTQIARRIEINVYQENEII